MNAEAGRLDWRWVAKCRLLGGTPTLELFEEAVAAGDDAVPLMVDVLSRRGFRLGHPPDCAQLPVHAMRVLGELRAQRALPALVRVLIDPVDPGLHGEEAALALARIGEPALAPLEGVLREPSRGTWVRASAARALVLAALADRRLRGRVLEVLQSLLRDPGERDRVFLAHLVADGCLLASHRLLPALASAFGGGRVDEEIVDRESVEIDILSRHHRPDPDAKHAVRRDVRDEYLSWEELSSGMPDDERRGFEDAFTRIDREGAEAPSDEEEE